MGEIKPVELKCPPGDMLIPPSKPGEEPFCTRSPESIESEFEPGGFGPGFPLTCSKPNREEDGKLYCNLMSSVRYYCPSSKELCGAEDAFVDYIFVDYPYDEKEDPAERAKKANMLRTKTEMEKAWELVQKGYTPGENGWVEGMMAEFSRRGAPIGVIERTEGSSVESARCIEDAIANKHSWITFMSRVGNESSFTLNSAFKQWRLRVEHNPGSKVPEWPVDCPGEYYSARDPDGSVRKMTREEIEQEDLIPKVMYEIELKDTKTREKKKIGMEGRSGEGMNVTITDLDGNNFPELLTYRNALGPNGCGSYYYVLYSKSSLDSLQTAFKRVVEPCIAKAIAAKPENPQPAIACDPASQKKGEE